MPRILLLAALTTLPLHLGSEYVPVCTARKADETREADGSGEVLDWLVVNTFEEKRPFAGNSWASHNILVRPSSQQLYTLFWRTTFKAEDDIPLNYSKDLKSDRKAYFNVQVEFPQSSLYQYETHQFTVLPTLAAGKSKQNIEVQFVCPLAYESLLPYDRVIVSLSYTPSIIPGIERVADFVLDVGKLQDEVFAFSWTTGCFTVPVVCRLYWSDGNYHPEPDNLTLCSETDNQCWRGTTFSLEDEQGRYTKALFGKLAHGIYWLYAQKDTALEHPTGPKREYLLPLNYVMQFEGSTYPADDWFAKVHMSDYCNQKVTECCIKVTFSRASLEWKYHMYTVKLVLEEVTLESTITSSESEEPEISRTFCNVSSGTYYSVVLATGQCSEYDSTVFSNSAVVEINRPTVLYTVLTCDTNAVIVNISHQYLDTRYDVRLCTGNASCPHAMENVNNEAWFRNVTAGEYGLWVSLSGTCKCRTDMNDNGTCVPCGNLIDVNVTVPNGLTLRDWSPHISATIVHNATIASDCVDGRFFPASDDYGFTGYTLTAVDTDSNLTAISAKGVLLTAVLPAARSSFMLCDIQHHHLKLEITPFGRCSAWEKTSASYVITIGKEQNSLFPTTSIVIGCISTISTVGVLLIIGRCQWRKSCRKGYNRFENVDSTLADTNSSRTSESVSQRDGMLFGGTEPEILMLYSSDSPLHIAAVTHLAEILENFGGCKVIFDRWLSRNEVEVNEWLYKQLTKAEKILIVNSEGAFKVQEATKSGRVYEVYAQQVPTHYHIFEALSLATKYPSLRAKLLSVSFQYSDATFKCTDDVIPVYRLLSDVGYLMGALHSASQPYQWSGKYEFESSLKVKELQALMDDMQRFIEAKPSYFIDAYGPCSVRDNSKGASSSRIGLSLFNSHHSQGWTECESISQLNLYDDVTLVSEFNKSLTRKLNDVDECPDKSSQNATERENDVATTQFDVLRELTLYLQGQELKPHDGQYDSSNQMRAEGSTYDCYSDTSSTGSCITLNFASNVDDRFLVR